MDLISLLRQSSVQKKTTVKKTKISDSRFNIVEENQEELSNSIQQTTATINSIPVFFNEEPRSQQQKQIKRGNAMIDELKKLRLGLIQGRIPMPTLKHLETLIQNRKKEPVVLEEALQSILDDIETRVSVELEKLNVKSQN